MNYFNADQREYMVDLATMLPSRRCWCGWFVLGECHSCPVDVSAADKLLARCDGCHNDPGPMYSRPITHRIGCERARDRIAIDLGLIDLGEVGA